MRRSRPSPAARRRSSIGDELAERARRRRPTSVARSASRLVDTLPPRPRRPEPGHDADLARERLEHSLALVSHRLPRPGRASARPRGAEDERSDDLGADTETGDRAETARPARAAPLRDRRGTPKRPHAAPLPALLGRPDRAAAAGRERGRGARHLGRLPHRSRRCRRACCCPRTSRRARGPASRTDAPIGRLGARAARSVASACRYAKAAAQPILVPEQRGASDPGGGSCWKPMRACYGYAIARRRTRAASRALTVFLVNRAPHARTPLRGRSLCLPGAARARLPARASPAADLSGYAARTPGPARRRPALPRRLRMRPWAATPPPAGSAPRRTARVTRVWTDPLPQAEVERVAPNEDAALTSSVTSAWRHWPSCVAERRRTVARRSRDLPALYGAWIDGTQRRKLAGTAAAPARDRRAAHRATWRRRRPASRAASHSLRRTTSPAPPSAS